MYPCINLTKYFWRINWFLRTFWYLDMYNRLKPLGGGVHPSGGENPPSGGVQDPAMKLYRIYCLYLLQCSLYLWVEESNPLEVGPKTIHKGSERRRKGELSCRVVLFLSPRKQLRVIGYSSKPFIDTWKTPGKSYLTSNIIFYIMDNYDLSYQCVTTVW